MTTVAPIALGNVISGLVDTLQAATGFEVPGTGGGDVPVFDGDVVSGERLFEALVIGSDGSPFGTSTQRPGSFRSAWGPTNLTLEEEGQVQCAVVVWAGDSTAATVTSQRDRVLEILAAADAALRASATAAALGVDELLWCHVSGGEVIAAVTDRGTETRLAFTVDYRAYLIVT